MRILLVSANKEKKPYPVAPIGIAYLSGVLLEDGNKVKVLDLCFIEDFKKSIIMTIEEFSPELIGISIRNIDNLTYPLSISYLPFIKSVKDIIKTVSDAPIVLGGSGFSISPEGMLDYLGLDTGVIGEGEIAIKELARGKSLENIPNIISREGNRFLKNPISQIKTFGTPFRGLIDNGSYLRWGGMGNIQTKRGCPFNCIYCTYPLLDGRKMRLRNPEEIGEEIGLMYGDYGIDYIYFVDDIFNYPVEHAENICREIIKRNIKIQWTAFCNPAFVTKDLLSLMKEAGCHAVEFGTDSLSDTLLRNLKKSFTVRDVFSASKASREAGLYTAHYIIIGGPGENTETIKETFKRLDELDPDAVIAMIGIRIYPGTLIEAMSKSDGFLKKGATIENCHNNGLEPVFYLPFGEKEDTLIEMIKEHALNHQNWVVPGLDIRSGGGNFMRHRKMGKRGPLWDLLKR